MKKILLLFFTALTLVSNAQQVPRCQIISNDHFGGNDGETIEKFPSIVTYPDGSFGVSVLSLSTASATIRTDCGIPGQNNSVIRHYAADYSTLIADICAPQSDAFADPSFFIFPQSNGNTYLFGGQVGPKQTGVELRDAGNNVLWTKFYGASGAGVTHIKQTSDGGFILAGGSLSGGGDVGMHYGSAMTFDIWIFKINANGDLLWSKVFGGTGEDLVTDMQLTADGGCFIFSMTTSNDHDAVSNHGSSDLFVIKLDSAGNKEWARCYGGTGEDGCAYDFGIKAISDNHGGFYVMNRTESADGDVQHRKPVRNNNEDLWADFWLLHIDSIGNILWENTYGAGGKQVPVDFCRAADGSLWMGGYDTGGYPVSSEVMDTWYGSTDTWVVHVDTLGNFINQRTIGANWQDELKAMQPLPDGSVLLFGVYRPNSGTNRSPGFPDVLEDAYNIFVTRVGPQTVGMDTPDFKALEWRLFPNPTKDALTIEVLQPLDGIYTLRIVDAKGAVMHSAAYKNPLKISTKTWASGNYYVNLIDAKGNKSTKKIIIQH